MRPGLIILNYHNIDWEDSLLTRALGFVTRPDVFAEHLRRLADVGELLSIQEGLARLARGDAFARPAFCLWFDDGFAGARRYALPICRERGITAAMSVSSRFVAREEVFWRCKLSFLALTDGLRELRRRLRRAGRPAPMKLRAWTLTHCDDALLQTLDDVWQEQTSPALRAAAAEAFDDEAGLAELVDAGWLIANHTAAHHPLTDARGVERALADFEACEPLVQRLCPGESYWALPFDMGGGYRDALRARARVVYVGNRVNTARSWEQRVIYRHSVASDRDILAKLELR